MCGIWNILVHTPDLWSTCCNLRIFKRQMIPAQLYQNKRGGKWIIKKTLLLKPDQELEHKYVSSFLSLIIHMLLGQIGFEELICGTEFLVRPSGLKWTVWIEDSSNMDKIVLVNDRLKELFEGTEVDKIEFYHHEGTLLTIPNFKQYQSKPKQSTDKSFYWFLRKKRQKKKKGHPD
uniref:Uncharacterized protein n=1 Tax=Arcella intermedia TaxID=1963864 RepID=A0A6B2LLP7_9EUKA